jgi:hypothetical protein
MCAARLRKIAVYYLLHPPRGCTGWDLEQNKVVRHYHGHLSGVYSVALHPTLDILITGGRDSVARVRAPPAPRVVNACLRAAAHRHPPLPPSDRGVP